MFQTKYYLTVLLQILPKYASKKYLYQTGTVHIILHATTCARKMHWICWHSVHSHRCNLALDVVGNGDPCLLGVKGAPTTGSICKEMEIQTWQLISIILAFRSLPIFPSSLFVITIFHTASCIVSSAPSSFSSASPSPYPSPSLPPSLSPSSSTERECRRSEQMRLTTPASTGTYLPIHPCYRSVSSTGTRCHVHCEDWREHLAPRRGPGSCPAGHIQSQISGQMQGQSQDQKIQEEVPAKIPDHIDSRPGHLHGSRTRARAFARAHYNYIIFSTGRR